MENPIESDFNIKIKNWYLSSFPNDNLGQYICDKANFCELADTKQKIANIYEYIGIADSIVRERIFEKLAELENISYEDVYKMWLNK